MLYTASRDASRDGHVTSRYRVRRMRYRIRVRNTSSTTVAAEGDDFP